SRIRSTSFIVIRRQCGQEAGIYWITNNAGLCIGSGKAGTMPYRRPVSYLGAFRKLIQPARSESESPKEVVSCSRQSAPAFCQRNHLPDSVGPAKCKHWVVGG